MEIEWTGSPNFNTGRNGKKITAIVDHITAGYMPGCLDWLKNPKSKASAHYLITKTGKVYQLVREADTAWHAGVVNKPNWALYDGTNPNRYTIGIEHEGQPNDGLTEAQYKATLQLHKELTAKYNIPIDKDHVIGHYRIDSVNRINCPGPKFPWDRLFADLSKKYDEAWKWALEMGLFKNEDKYKAVQIEDIAWALYKLYGKQTNNVKYTKQIIDGVLVVELDPMILKCKDMVLKTGKELAKEYTNFTNGNFFLWEHGQIKKTIGWLVSEGNILSSRYEHKEFGWAGNPKGTFIVYKNGNVEVGWKWDSDIGKVEKDIWFMAQGFNLYPPNMTLKNGLAKEGWDYDSVGYKTNRIAIGYNPETKKAVITVEKDSNAEQAVITMGKFGCAYNAICLDSGLSCNAVVDGEEFITTDRQLANIIYW
jgi:N-acetyl-anhydromuramyl-L-alanine amidase AmpD